MAATTSENFSISAMPPAMAFRGRTSRITCSTGCCLPPMRRAPGGHRPGMSFRQLSVPWAISLRGMNQDGTRDLAWWRIPAWASAAPRVIATGLVFRLLFGRGGPVFGLVAGPMAALLYALGGGLRGRPPVRIARPRWRQLFSAPSLVGMLVFGLAAGLVGGLSTGLLRAQVRARLAGSRAGSWPGSREGSPSQERTMRALLLRPPPGGGIRHSGSCSGWFSGCWPRASRWGSYSGSYSGCCSGSGSPRPGGLLSRSLSLPCAGLPLLASCGSLRMPASARSCAQSDRSTSSATLACRIASPCRSHRNEPQ